MPQCPIAGDPNVCTVCLCLVPDPTFKSLDLESSFLVLRSYVFRISRSGFSIKVIDQCQGHTSVSKCTHTHVDCLSDNLVWDKYVTPTLWKAVLSNSVTKFFVTSSMAWNMPSPSWQLTTVVLCIFMKILGKTWETKELSKCAKYIDCCVTEWQTVKRKSRICSVHLRDISWL